ncbi:ankyrin-1 [Microplitis demolitor]|uniref:ankyrin-1 n=1 Tax=Microplitis demolitor TaxID=69319 RepID=UPI0004CDDBF4|nr:ankyrin-1 [Microplitis demolitor]
MSGYDSTWRNLLTAVQLGDLPRVRELLRTEDELSDLSTWTDSYLLLRDAIADAELEIVECLLENNATVNRRSKKATDTPLHLAVHIGDPDLLNSLLDRGANVTAKGKYKKTPVHIAAEYSKVEILELLISKGGNINDKDQHGLTPLCWALKKGKLEIVDYILNHENYDGSLFNHSSKEADTQLHFAVTSGNEELVRYLINKGAQVNAQGIDSKTPLHIAVEENLEKIVECLLDNGADVNYTCSYCGEEECTALHIAADKSNEKILELLLNKGADINAVTANGINPLHVAACRNNVECVKIILNNNRDVDYLNRTTADEGFTPLHFASIFGCNYVADFILNMNADINILSYDNSLPIHFAVSKGHDKVVELLLNHGANVDSLFDNTLCHKTLLFTAVVNGDLKIVEHLLKFSPDITCKCNIDSLKVALRSFSDKSKGIAEALLDYGFKLDFDDVDSGQLIYTAVEKGLVGIVKDIIKAGIDITELRDSTFLSQGFTLLHSAVINKHLEIVKLLIDKVDINTKDGFGLTPISYAAENNDIDMVKFILDYNNLDDMSKCQLLFGATKKSSKEIIELSLQYGIDVNMTDERGRTALHVIDLGKYESQKEDSARGEIAKLLISKGANVNARTNDNDTALAYAVLHQNPYVVEALLLHGANIDHLNSFGDTLLHMAAIKGKIEIIRLLIQHGVAVDSPNNRGVTPLHFAVENNNEEAVICLIEYGADVNWINKKSGRTALHLAVEKNLSTIVRVLLKCGSDINIVNFHNQTPFSYTTNASCLFEIIQVLREHVIKLKCANFKVNCNDLNLVDTFIDSSDFYSDCMKEIESMGVKIVDSNKLTYRHILSKSIQKLSIYSKNVDISKRLESDDTKNTFPLYYDLLINRFNEGVKREKILQTLYDHLDDLFPRVSYNCIDEIFCYLSNDDLKLLRKACNPNNQF